MFHTFSCKRTEQSRPLWEITGTNVCVGGDFNPIKMENLLISEVHNDLGRVLNLHFYSFGRKKLK